MSTFGASSPMSAYAPGGGIPTNGAPRPDSLYPQPPLPPGESRAAAAGGLGKLSGNAPPPPRRSRWLLCYPSGGTENSESPSSPSDSESNMSTPSPTDHGFRIPNSYSNERPTTLPVALLTSARNNGEILHELMNKFHVLRESRVAQAA